MRGPGCPKNPSRVEVDSERRGSEGHTDEELQPLQGDVMNRTEPRHLQPIISDTTCKISMKSLHFKQIVRSTCMTPSVCSSHSPPFPLTIPPIPLAPTPAMSLLSSMRSAFVQTTTMAIPAELFVSVPCGNGRTFASARVAVVIGSGSAVGSV